MYTLKFEAPIFKSVDTLVALLVGSALVNSDWDPLTFSGLAIYTYRSFTCFLLPASTCHPDVYLRSKVGVVDHKVGMAFKNFTHAKRGLGSWI